MTKIPRVRRKLGVDLLKFVLLGIALVVGYKLTKPLIDWIKVKVRKGYDKAVNAYHKGPKPKDAKPSYE